MVSRAPEMAVLLIESPALAGALGRDLVFSVFERWPDASPAEIELAVDVALEIADARSAFHRTRRQELIETARLFHGVAAAARLVAKYRPEPVAVGRRLAA